MDSPAPLPSSPAADPADAPGLAERVKTGIIWRSGSQIVGQLIAWTATFLVIRLLDPADYGLVAMTGVVLTFLDLFKGWGFASALVREERTDSRRIGQAFAMLILMNGALAALQIAAAPLAATYFHQPMVADLLRVQALFYLANPFNALGHALLARRLEFKRQSRIDLVAAMASAATACGCALAGAGIWTLVAAPAALWYTRAIGYILAARLWHVRPRFDFAGACAMVRYGGAMIGVQVFWFVQSQADVFIGGRALDPHRLGIYTTALFLTQILAAKFVPPLNEVAFGVVRGARLHDAAQAQCAHHLADGNGRQVLRDVAHPHAVGRVHGDVQRAHQDFAVPEVGDFGFDEVEVVALDQAFGAGLEAELAVDEGHDGPRDFLGVGSHWVPAFAGMTDRWGWRDTAACVLPGMR